MSLGFAGAFLFPAEPPELAEPPEPVEGEPVDVA
jgi:hypothetical protein